MIWNENANLPFLSSDFFLVFGGSNSRVHSSQKHFSQISENIFSNFKNKKEKKKKEGNKRANQRTNRRGLWIRCQPSQIQALWKILSQVEQTKITYPNQTRSFFKINRIEVLSILFVGNQIAWTWIMRSLKLNWDNIGLLYSRINSTIMGWKSFFEKIKRFWITQFIQILSSRKRQIWPGGACINENLNEIRQYKLRIVV